MMRKVIIIELEEDWTKKWWDILLLRKLFGIKMDQVEDFENSWSICKDLLHISLRVNNQFYEKFLNEINSTSLQYLQFFSWYLLKLTLWF